MQSQNKKLFQPFFKIAKKNFIRDQELIAAETEQKKNPPLFIANSKIHQHATKLHEWGARDGSSLRVKIGRAHV